MSARITPRRPRRRVLVLVVAPLALLLLVAGILAATLPPVRRLVADPAGERVRTGVTRVAVVGEAGQNHAYGPPVIQVPAGTTVTWEFRDRGPSGGDAPVPHNVVGDGFASPVLAEGTWAHRFDRPGDYRYRCTLHRYMDGRVVVTPR